MAKDSKKEASAAAKSLKAAREAIFNIRVEVGDGKAGKELGSVITDIQKCEMAFSKTLKALPAAAAKDSKKDADTAQKEFKAAREAILNIQVELGGNSSGGKEMAKLIGDIQKLEMSLQKAAKSL